MTLGRIKRRVEIDTGRAYEIGQEMDIDWEKVDLNEFTIGLNIEQEHIGTVNGCVRKIALIALDHLKEFPDYYTRLVEMEQQAEEFWGS
jgi:hypothetical protein